MKKVYKTSKRFNGSKGAWTDSPNLEIEMDGTHLKIDFTNDKIRKMDINFTDNFHKFNGTVQEEVEGTGPVDYRGELLAS